MMCLSGTTVTGSDWLNKNLSGF